MQREFSNVIQRVNRRVVSESHSLPSDDSHSPRSDDPSKPAVPSMATARNGFIKISSRDSKLMQELMQVCSPLYFIVQNSYLFHINISRLNSFSVRMNEVS